MKILITDYGKYIPYGSSYYESIELFNFLKANGEDVDILKYVIISPIDGSITENEALIRKYNFIISYTPFDFDFIIRYKKTAKINPKIIFIDEFNFIKVIGSKIGFFDPKKALYNKFIKILQDIKIYAVHSRIDEDFVHKTITNIDTIYINPYVKESYFVKPNKIYRDKLVFSGRLNPSINNINLLLKAIKYIVKETSFLEEHNLSVLLTNTDESEEIKNKINKMKLNEYFIFIPPIKNYPELITSLGFSVVLPLQDIRIGSILESMAAGLPIIIPDNKNSTKLFTFNGVVRERIIENGKNGLIYDHEDYKDLAEKIMFMMTINKEKYMEMRDFAYSYASDFSSKYEYKKIYDGIKEIYLNETKAVESREFSKI